MNENVKKPREWTIVPMTEYQKGQDGLEYPVEKIQVTFREHTWTLPNSPAGRAEALRRVNVIRGREATKSTLEHMMKRVCAIRGEVSENKLAEERTEGVVQMLSMVEANLHDALTELNGG